MIEILILIYVCSIVIAFIDFVHWYLDFHLDRGITVYGWILIAAFILTPLMNTVAAALSIRRLVKK